MSHQMASEMLMNQLMHMEASIDFHPLVVGIPEPVEAWIL
jgi:hypothetical protein